MFSDLYITLITIFPVSKTKQCLFKNVYKFYTPKFIYDPSKNINILFSLLFK